MTERVLDKILPPSVAEALKPLAADKLCEVRLRSGGAVTALYNGRYMYVTPRGISDSYAQAIVLDAPTVMQVMLLACEKSLYAFNDRICQGFLTLAGGVRVGIAGETVWEGDRIKTIKNFTALDIRIPHEVRGCGEKVAELLRCGHGYHSTLIVSPPGAGKTTLLRDLTRIVSSRPRPCNVLVVDERDEIAAVADGRPTHNVGRNTDVISGCTKEFAFSRGIRAMRPDVIVTDELCGAKDVAAVESAVQGGVSVFASVHADSHKRLREKRIFASLLANKCFTRFVDVSERNGPGTVEGVFDADFREVAGGA